MPNRFWKHLKAKKTFLQAHENNQEAVIKLPTKQKRAQEKDGRRRDQTAKMVLVLLRKKRWSNCI